MSLLLVWLCWLCGPAPAGATSLAPEPQMFAYGSSLELPGTSPIYYCDIPLEIYRSTSRQDLGDLRVFNGRNQVVPHLLNKAPAAPASSRKLPTDLPFFPLPSPSGRIPTALAVQIKNSASSTSIEVTTTATTSPAATCGYLFDTEPPGAPQTSAHPGPVILDLEWSAQQPHYLGNLRVDTSADLLTWHPLTTATLVRMHHQGYRLERNAITIPPHRCRYLRLLWTQDQAAIAVSRATLLTTAAGAPDEPPNSRWLIAPIETSAKTPGQFSVDLGGALPVDRLRIRLPDNNSLAVASLATAPAPNGPYTQVWQGLLYHLDTDQEEILNPIITFHPTPRRYWQISFASSEVEQRQPPELSFAWQPEQLVFLAQGARPFRVLYGSPDIQPTDFKLQSLIGRTQGEGGSSMAPSRGRIGPRFVQNPAVQLPTSAALPWRKYTFWLSLTCGVLLIGWMVSQLYRQLQKDREGDKDNQP